MNLERKLREIESYSEQFKNTALILFGAVLGNTLSALFSKGVGATAFIAFLFCLWVCFLFQRYAVRIRELSSLESEEAQNNLKSMLKESTLRIIFPVPSVIACWVILITIAIMSLELSA